MATLWVSTAGSDANDGSSYALAKATPYAAIGAAVQGDVVNIVNDGIYALGLFNDYWNVGPIDGTFNGTSWANPGLTIRGCDSAGDPAIATMRMNVGASASVGFRMLNTARYITIQGIRFDYSPGEGSSSSNRYAIWMNGAQPFRRIYDCEFDFGDIGTGNTATGTLPSAFFADGSSGVTDGTVEIARCVFRNFPLNTGFGAFSARIEYDVHHNVMIFDNDTALSPATYGSHSGAGKPRRFYNNTIVRRHYGSTTAPGGVTSIGNDVALLDVHSNLFAIECGTSVASSGMAGFVMQGYTLAAAGTPVNLGYNLHALGPSLSAFYSGWTGTGLGIASYQFNDNFNNSLSWAGTNINPNCVLATNVERQEVFNATTAAWTWVTDATYTHDLPFDMRPLLGRTTALDGGVVGAIDTAINLPPVVSNPWPGGTGLGEITAGSTLSVSATSGLATTASDPDDDPMTYVLVDDVTHGTLTLNTTDGSFEYTPDATYEGDDGFTYNVCDGTTCTTRIVDTLDRPYASLIVLPYPVVPPGDPDPVPVPYVDTAPFFRPTLEITTEFRYKSRKNRRKHHDLANYTERVLWDESLHRVINLATNTSTQVTLGGVADGEYLIVETDTDINVSINGDGNYWPVSKVVAVALTSATSLYLQNESTTNEAQVILAVSD